MNSFEIVTIAEKQITELADAMWQLLDDMGENGQSVCLQAKAEARIAIDPFLTVDRPECDNWMSLAQAKALINYVENRRNK